jgi:hypothetical protein
MRHYVLYSFQNIEQFNVYTDTTVFKWAALAMKYSLVTGTENRSSSRVSSQSPYRLHWSAGEKTCTYSSDQAVVVWTRLNNDLFTLLILSVVHWLMALCQHSLHTDLAALLILKPSWHTCSIPTSSHWLWCSSCSLMSLGFNNISAVPQWTGPHSLQTHTNT